MRVPLLVLILVLGSIPMQVEATSGRALSVNIELQENMWTSDDIIPLNVSISGAPFNRDIILKWHLSDENGIIFNGTIPFRMSASVHLEQFSISQFFTGSSFYEISVEVIIDSTSAFDDESFTVLRKSILPPMSNLVIFGDSLSDMGNADSSLIVSTVFSSPPYYSGRFSNGPVWVEHVSDYFGLTTSFGDGLSQGDNRAFGGSQTGQGYAYLTLPNVGTQIGNYLANVQSSFTNTDLIFLWAGGNDFLYGSANPDLVSRNMASHVETLALAGATNFVVVNLPPLEMTPEGASRSQSQQSTMANNVVSYNNKLSIEMTNLSSSMNLDITLIDAWTIFNEIVNNAEHVGIVNTQDQACSGGATLPIVSSILPICGTGASVVSNPNEYLFFDKAHPTATMHKVIGEYAVMSIGESDTDGDGIIDLLDQCDWTNDFSSVDSTGCDYYQQDEDSDGVANGLDICLGTESGFEVDENGCADYQKDTDNDGLTDDIDPCPFGSGDDDHDSDGCVDIVDQDDDNDGIEDEDDSCPRGLIGLHEFDFDQDGCHDDEDTDDDNDGLTDLEEDEIGSDKYDRDTDGDGYLDGDDAFPLDPDESRDTDGDGFGDRTDDFPFDETEWKDSDYDEVGDNSDAFPNDPYEWADTDLDGIGDNTDDCPDEAGDSIFPTGCLDSDSDGFADEIDSFPNDNGEWNDTDGDGYGDNFDAFPENSSEWSDADMDGYGDNIDAFPQDALEWKDSDLDGCGDNSDAFPFDGTECLDSDSDGVGDNSDLWPLNPLEWKDTDFDGVGDNADFAPNNPLEHTDSDGDGVGDNSDLWPKDSSRKYDSDGDGVADSMDAFPNDPNRDSWTGIIVGLCVILTLVIVVIFYFKKPKKEENIEQEWDSERPIEAPDSVEWK